MLLNYNNRSRGSRSSSAPNTGSSIDDAASADSERAGGGREPGPGPLPQTRAGAVVREVPTPLPALRNEAARQGRALAQRNASIPDMCKPAICVATRSKASLLATCSHVCGMRSSQPSLPSWWNVACSAPARSVPRKPQEVRRVLRTPRRALGPGRPRRFIGRSTTWPPASTSTGRTGRRCSS